LAAKTQLAYAPALVVVPDHDLPDVTTVSGQLQTRITAQVTAPHRPALATCGDASAGEKQQTCIWLWACLVGREARCCSTAHDGQDVAAEKHLNNSNARIVELSPELHRRPGDHKSTRLCSLFQENIALRWFL